METVLTDDRGAYRIFGLPPNEYVVYAAERSTLVSEATSAPAAHVDATLRQLKQDAIRTEQLRSVALAPTYHPGVVRLADAGRIVVGVGEEHTAVDIGLQVVVTSRIEGTVVDPIGSILAGASVSLDPDGPRLDGNLSFFMSRTAVDAEGRFAFRGVTPGKYTITVRARRPSAADSAAVATAPSWALAQVDIDGNEVYGLTMTLRSALRVAGRVTFDATRSTPALSSTRYSVQLRPDPDLQMDDVRPAPSTALAAQVAPDGSFDVRGVLPGHYMLDVVQPQRAGWVLRSIVVDGRDIADLGIEVGESDVNGVAITMTDRPAELSGTLHAADRSPAQELTVVVIPSDRELWKPNSRRIRVVRPGTDGRFIVRDLAPGEYLLGAVIDLDLDELRDPRILEQIANESVKVTLAEGERKTQNLRVAGRQRLQTTPTNTDRVPLRSRASTRSVVLRLASRLLTACVQQVAPPGRDEQSSCSNRGP